MSDDARVSDNFAMLTIKNDIVRNYKCKMFDSIYSGSTEYDLNYQPDQVLLSYNEHFH